MVEARQRQEDAGLASQSGEWGMAILLAAAASSRLLIRGLTLNRTRCNRCSNRENFKSGEGYDLCICVHAEQNALLSAARFGIAVQGGIVYSTTRPCFGCTKELLQAHINKVYYLHEWSYPKPEVQGEYQKLQARFPEGIEKVNIDDPKAEWAVSSLRQRPQTVDDTGHSPS